jgi:cation diffusion facilitator CzcD-associated flavoprotein CzcO
MLQRSPTYVMNLPKRNNLFVQLKKWLPERAAYRITRWSNLLLGMTFYRLSRSFPHVIKRFIIRDASKRLGPGYQVNKHFNPRYNPWDQRLCVVPDGDLFEAIRQGKASVVTDEISHFTSRGIQLKSGEELPADLIVLATGLNIKLLGGVVLTVNGKPVNPNEEIVYKGMMLSEVPNFVMAFGYTNASWTLKTDLTANYVCKLLNYMAKKGYQIVAPRRQRNVAPEPFLNFQSGYIQRADSLLPKQGSRRPWRVYQNYLMDMMTTRYGRVDDGVLEFKSKAKKG